MRFIDLTGQRFSRLLVLKQAEQRLYNRTTWTCLCDCGNTKDIVGTNLVRGYSKSCGCFRIEVQSELGKTIGTQKLHRAMRQRFTGHGGISGKHWDTLQRNAAKKNRVVAITIEQAWELFLSQNGKCALSGLPIWFRSHFEDKTHINTTASLDRIDSSKDYTLDNVQWVHKDVNTLKGPLPDSRLIELCRAITIYQDELKSDNGV